MSAVERANADAEFQDAVDILIERYGPEDAEMRLLAALGEVRKRKVELKRGGGG